MTSFVIPAKVTKNGTFTMPARIRDLLGIEDTFLFEIKENKVTIKPKKLTLQSTFGSIKPLKEGMSIEQAIRLAKEEKAERTIAKMKEN